MQTPKKRKRERVEVEPPRITYDAPTRVFDRLFKEDSLEAMKDVVRKKLTVASSVPIYLSQVRDGKSVDLEDDDDFDAFRSFAHATEAVQVKVVVGSLLPPEGSEKKKKKSTATVPSPIASSSALVDSPPPKRKRRVSFVEPPRDQPEENAAVSKEKHKHDVDSSIEPELGNEAPSDPTLQSSMSTTNAGLEKKKKKTKKRKRESTGEVTTELPPPSQPQEAASLAGEDDDIPRPAKKSKKKRKESMDEPISLPNSRSKSVPPASMRQTSPTDIPDPLPSPSIEPEGSIKPKKTNMKGKSRALSEPPNAAAPSSPEPARHDEAPNEKKKKGKSKTKAKVDDDSSVNPSASRALQEGPTSRKDKEVEELPAAPAEPKIPRKKGKSQTTETSKASKSGTALEESRDLDDSQEPNGVMAVTLEAIRTVLARKRLAASAQTTAPQATVHVSSPSTEEEESIEPLSSCPVCDESPTHDRPLCPVIKGGVKTMRKRVAQLEKDTSGDEAKQKERQQVLADLLAMIQKRSRKPKTSNAVVNGDSLPATAAPIAPAKKSKAVINEDPLPGTPALIAPAKKSNTVINRDPLPATPAPIAPAKKSKAVMNEDPLPATPAPIAPAKKSAKQINVGQDRSTTEKSKKSRPLPSVGDPDTSTLGRSFEDLSQITDHDLRSIIHGPKVSIADLPSSDEEEEEQDQEEPLLDEDEPQPKTPRRLSQGSTRLQYPSSSDAGEEDDNSADGSLTKAKAVLPINGKSKTTEADSDTAVGSQGEELVDLQTKEEAFKSGTTVENPAETSEPPSDERPALMSLDDDDFPPQSTPMVESVIRTRSQRRKDAEKEEDSAIQASKKTKNKDTKRPANTTPKASTSETLKGKASTKAVSRSSAASKPKSLYKITAMGRQLADAMNKAAENNESSGSQWAVLQESNLTETPGQVDELLSDVAAPGSQSTTSLNENQDGGSPLFLPPETQTQQSFPYSQYPEIFASQMGAEPRKPSHNESDDEKEVLASVVKAKTPRTYRSLSQIANSQKFSVPRFQPAVFGRTKEPESMYGKTRRDDVESETDSSSESDLEEKSPTGSHIPASRQAGLSKK